MKGWRYHLKELRITKRIVTALICAAIALSCAAVPVRASASGDTLTVGVPTDRCPVFYRDADTGEITGIGVDLMRAATEEAGYAVAFKAMEEGTLKEALDNETYSVVMPFGSAIASASGRSSVVSDNLTRVVRYILGLYLPFLFDLFFFFDFFLF